ncbi:hypothetical protein FM113_00605 [Leucobacter sp. 7(1)]|nr:hypothetical protein FM113_00605 [Leucobacter sp. 7(1)]
MIGVMALIYDTTMSPSKHELLAAWLPTRPWFRGDVALLERVAAYRVDDPEGEVGIEGHFVTAGDDTIFHVPLTYRGAALADGDDFLLDTTAHGVLGTRWIIDGTGDPVFRTVIAETIVHGGRETEEWEESASGVRTPREPATRLRGSGAPDHAVPELWAASVSELGGVTVAETGFATLRIPHVLDAAALAGGPIAGLPTDAQQAGVPGADGHYALRASWAGQPVPVTIATLSTVAPE